MQKKKKKAFAPVNPGLKTLTASLNAKGEAPSIPLKRSVGRPLGDFNPRVPVNVSLHYNLVKLLNEEAREKKSTLSKVFEDRLNASF